MPTTRSSFPVENSPDSKLKILVVDDDPVARLLMAAILKASGYDVTSVDNADTAWGRLADRSIQIVVADWWMPGTDGMELCRRIRRRGGSYIYFILVTNQSDSAENSRASSSAGIDDYVTKPVQAAELRLRVESGARVLTARNLKEDTT